jgi:hypothetical protein
MFQGDSGLVDPPGKAGAAGIVSPGDDTVNANVAFVPTLEPVDIAAVV